MDFTTEIVEELKKDGGNAYRTRNYIVLQHLEIQVGVNGSKTLESNDIYFKRTISRDTIFEKLFENSKPKNGRRVRTAMYSRMYVD